MKIELGYYRTLAGKVRVICTDRKGSCPIVALVNDEEMVAVYDAKGKTGLSLGGNSFDLIEPWREPVKYSVDVWLNNHPEIKPDAIDITRYLFGKFGGWNPIPNLAANKHYRITVEEIMP